MITEAMLYDRLASGDVECHLCAHKCRLAPSQFGICGVRQNQDGTLYSMVFGELIASHVDPIEKKPLYHFWPGTSSFSIATVGCNFSCGFCQNWQISQVSKSDPPAHSSKIFAPDDVVKQAAKHNCQSISYTYTEPTIFFEYAYAVAQLAHRAGLLNVFITNGYITETALAVIAPFLDAANVDLKSFREQTYRSSCGAHLQPVLDTIRAMRVLDIWTEITTLVIPGENDSAEELTDIAQFIADVDPGMPWHISRFHPDYKYDHYSGPTPLKTLEKARDIGKNAGLKHVYLGNVNHGNDTFCSTCGQLLISRTGYHATLVSIEYGRCKACHAPIRGIWN